MNGLAEAIIGALLKCEEEPLLAMDYLRGYLTSEYSGGDREHTGNMLLCLRKAEELVAAHAGSVEMQKKSGGRSIVTISERQLEEDRQADRNNFAFVQCAAVLAVDFCSCSSDTDAPSADVVLTLMQFMVSHLSLAWKFMLSTEDAYSPAKTREFCAAALDSLLKVITLEMMTDDIVEKLSYILSASVAVTFISCEDSFPSSVVASTADLLLSKRSDSVVANLVLALRDIVQFKDMLSVSKRVMICRRHWYASQLEASVMPGSRNTAAAAPVEIDYDATSLLRQIKAGLFSLSSFSFTGDQILSSATTVINNLCCILCAMYNACSPVSVGAASSKGSTIDVEIVLCAEARVRYAALLATWCVKIEDMSTVGSECTRLLQIFTALNIAVVVSTAPAEPCVLFPSTETLLLAKKNLPDLFTQLVVCDRVSAHQGEMILSSFDSFCDKLSGTGPFLIHCTLRLLASSGYYAETAAICKIMITRDDLAVSTHLICAQYWWCFSMAAVVNHRRSLLRPTTDSTYETSQLQLSLTAELLRDVAMFNNQEIFSVLVEADEAIMGIVEKNHDIPPEELSDLHYRCGVLRWMMGGDRQVNAKAKNGAMTALMACAKINPSCGPMYSIMGHYYHCIAHDVARATKCYLKALSLDPSDAEAGVSLCLIYLAAGDIAKVTKLWDDICLMTSNAYWAHATRGRYLLSCGSLEGAVTFLQRALEKRSGNESSWFELGLCYLYQRQYLAAQRALERAKDLSPGFIQPRVYIALGQVHRHLCLYAESVYYLSLALSTLPAFSAPSTTLCVNEIAAQSEVNIRTAIIAMKGLSDTYLAMVHHRLTIGWTQGAASASVKGIECCDKLILILEAAKLHRDRNDGEELLSQLKICVYKNLGDLCMSWTSLSPWDAVILKSKNTSCNTIPSHCLLLDFLLRAENAYQHVLNTMEEGIDGIPAADLASAYYDIGSAVYAQGVQHLLGNGQGSGLLPTSLFFVESAGREAKALTLYKRAKELFSAGIRKDPLHSGCWNGLGVTVIKSNENLSENDLFKQKIMCFNRACQIDANASAYANIGVLLAHYGNRSGARACFSSLQVIESNPLLWVALGSIMDMENYGKSTEANDKLSAAQLAYDAFSASLEVMKPTDGLIGHAVGWIRLHDASSWDRGEGVFGVLASDPFCVSSLDQWACDALERNHYRIEFRHNVEIKVRAYLYRRPMCHLGWTLLAWALFQRCLFVEAAKAYWQSLVVLDQVAAYVNTTFDAKSSIVAASQELSAGLILERAAKVMKCTKRCVDMACVQQLLTASDASLSLHIAAASVQAHVTDGLHHEFGSIHALSERFGVGVSVKSLEMLDITKITSGECTFDVDSPLRAYVLCIAGKFEEACRFAKDSLYQLARMPSVAKNLQNDEDNMAQLQIAVTAIASNVACDCDLQKKGMGWFNFLIFASTQNDASKSIFSDVFAVVSRGALLLNSISKVDDSSEVEVLSSDYCPESDIMALGIYFLLASDIFVALSFLSTFSKYCELDSCLSVIFKLLAHRYNGNPLMSLALSYVDPNKYSPWNAYVSAIEFIKTASIGENYLLQRDKRNGNLDLVEPAAAIDVMCSAVVLCTFDNYSNTTVPLPADKNDSFVGLSKKDLLKALKWDPVNKNIWIALSLLLLNENVASNMSRRNSGDADLLLCKKIVCSLSHLPGSRKRGSLPLSLDVEHALKFADATTNMRSEGGNTVTLFFQARELLSKNQGKEAITAYKQILESGGMDSIYMSYAWRELGDAYALLMMAECAQHCYKTSMAQSVGPLDNAIYLMLAALAFYNRYLKIGNKEDAITARKYIDECCSSNNKLAASILLRSSLLANLGDTSKAESGVKKAISIWDKVTLPGYHPASLSPEL